MDQKHNCEDDIKVTLRAAVTTAWTAGYDACSNGEDRDGQTDVMESIIGDAWGKIKKTVSDAINALIDQVKEEWDNAIKTLNDMFRRFGLFD